MCVVFLQQVVDWFINAAVVVCGIWYVWRNAETVDSV